MKYHAFIIVVAAAALVGGCGQDTVITANAKKQHAEFIDVKPKAEDIVGIYTLSSQTVVSGGMLALGGRQCQLHVRADGGFSITNYPQSTEGKFSSFVSATGTWRLATVGTSYGYGPTPKECWGLRFSGSSTRIDPTAFTGHEQPYGMLTILGDPDSNLTLGFKKERHTTTKSTLSSEGAPSDER